MEPGLPGRYAALSGDANPVHTDDAVARAAGFERGVVLHGMCTLAWAADALVRAAGGPLGFISARFAAPVHPGDEVEFTVTADGDDRWRLKAVIGPAEALRAAVGRVGYRAVEAAAPPPDAIRAERPPADAQVLAVAQLLDLHPHAHAAVAAALLCRAAVFGAAARSGLDLNGGVHTAQQLTVERPLGAGERVVVYAWTTSDATRAGLQRVVVRSVVVGERDGQRHAVADWTLVRRDASAGPIDLSR